MSNTHAYINNSLCGEENNLVSSALSSVGIDTEVFNNTVNLVRNGLQRVFNNIDSSNISNLINLVGNLPDIVGSGCNENNFKNLLGMFKAIASIVRSSRRNEDINAVRNRVKKEICGDNNSCNNWIDTLFSTFDNHDNYRRVLTSSLFDTCYEENRAERLFKGLKALSSNNGDIDCSLVRLLFASYVAMLSKDNDDVFEYIEWVPLLLRAVARVRNSGAYIPVCPGRGDVAAVGYYLLLCCR